MMKIFINNRWFTFAELTVVVVILTILGTIWFSSFVWNLSSSRDSQRKSDFWQIVAAMKLYNKNKWSHPIPQDYFSISNGSSSNVVVWQWKLWTNVWLSTLDKIPLDPKLKIPYFYSITRNKQEFQIAWTLENDDNPKAILFWSYKSVAKNVLPTIIIAWQSTTNVDITNATNKKLFVFDWQWNNLVYDFEWSNSPVTNWTEFGDLLSRAENSKVFFQNSSFETCEEIREAWKSIWNWNYELRNSTWALVTTSCTWM